jgi:hypothetical protein
MFSSADSLYGTANATAAAVTQGSRFCINRHDFSPLFRADSISGAVQ